MYIEVLKSQYDQPIARVRGDFREGARTILAKALKVKPGNLYDHLGYDPVYVATSIAGKEAGKWVYYPPCGFRDRQGRSVVCFYLRHRSKSLRDLACGRSVHSLINLPQADSARSGEGVSLSGGLSDG